MKRHVARSSEMEYNVHVDLVQFLMICEREVHFYLQWILGSAHAK